MKNVFTCFIVMLFALASTGQTAKVNTTGTPIAKAGDILNLQESQFDFGKIPQGKPVTHIFNVDNSGNDSLKISNIQASCGCTTPEWTRGEVVPPGGNTKITVGYNAAGDGNFSKTITVTYNGNKTKQITIKGDVWKTPTSSAPENTSLDNLKNQ